MSRADTTQKVPRAMIHRRILDVAETNPDATLEAIADEVSGASSPLVERVLDEYGDPADTTGSGSPTADGSDGETTDDRGVHEAVDEGAVDEEAVDDEIGDETGDEPMDGDESDEQQEASMNAQTNGQQTTNGSTEMADPDITLSDKQRRTLCTVYDHPEASQGDIAEALGVTRPTVSRRLNSIPGFEWSERRSFARSVFESEAEAKATTEETADAESNPDSAESGATTEQTTASESDQAPVAANESEPEPGLDGPEEDSPNLDETEAEAIDVSEIEEMLTDLDRRLSEVESDEAVETESDTSGNGESNPDMATATLSPELAHKVAHACLTSDRVSEDEEMELLRSLMQG